MGSLFRSKPVQQRLQPAAAPNVADESASAATEEQKKRKVRALLLGTEGGSEGVLSTATTARGKLLGN